MSKYPRVKISTSKYLHFINLSAATYLFMSAGGVLAAGLDLSGSSQNWANSADISSADRGINITGSGNKLTNSGDITSDEDAIGAVGDGNTVINHGDLFAGENLSDILAGTMDPIGGNNDNGVELDGDNNTIVNHGTVRASDDGLDVEGDGAVVKNYGNVIAYDDAIDIAGDNATVFNSGFLKTLDGSGIEITGANASITNTGTIDVGDTGIAISGTNASVSNSGTIDADNVGIVLNGVDAVLVNTGDIISQNHDGIQMFSDRGQIVNHGNIAGLHGDGIYVSGDQAEIYNYGHVNGTVDGIYVNGAFSHIYNAGEITSGHAGVEIAGGGATVLNTGSINAGTDGISINGDGVTVTNSGLITTQIDDGLDINGSHAHITNSGEISSADDGIDAFGDHNLIVNYGRVISDSDGIVANDSGGVIGSHDNTLVNYGFVQAASDGLDANGDGNHLTNYGSIVAGDNGFEAGGIGNVLSNFGTIEAEVDGINMAGPLGEVYNSGSIHAKNAGISVSGDSARVVNSGRVFVDNHLVNAAIEFRDLSADAYLALNAGSHIQGRIEFTGTNNTLHMGSGWDTMMTITGDMAEVNVTGDGQKVVVDGQRVISVDGDGAAATAINAARLRAELTGAVQQDINSRIEAAQRCEDGTTYCRNGWWINSRVAAQDGTSDNPYSHVMSINTVGIDAALDQGGMAGLLGGISFSRSEVLAENGETEATTAYFGGYYSRMFGPAFANLSLVGGYMWQDNARVFYDNTVLGGIVQSDDQTIGSTFVTPAFTLGYRTDVSQGFTLVPTIGARYTYSARKGYKEAVNSNITVDAQQEHRVDVRAQLAMDWNGYESGDFGKWNARLRGGVDLYKSTTVGEGSTAYGTALAVSDQSDSGVRPFFGFDIFYDLGERLDVSLGVEAAYDTNEVLAASGHLSSSLNF
ncbi:autotransporter domain-containing protein [Rhodobacteraceae bacterium RKSG542]|nr:autotransporter domain-containing protein [Pseudovibrio flavus]